MGPSVSPAGETSQQSPSSQLRQVVDGDPFGLAVEDSGSTLYLRLTGVFDLACIGRVEATLERISEADTRFVVFDLTEVRFLDSAGLHTILRANERARTAAFEVIVVRPRGLANRVFTLTRAGQELRLVDAAFPPSAGDC